MSNTQITPTDKHGNIYYGPRTLGEAIDLLEETDVPIGEITNSLKEAGFAGVAARLKKYYNR